MKRPAIVLALIAAAACSEDPTAPPSNTPLPETGVLVDNGTGASLIVRSMPCTSAGDTAYIEVSDGATDTFDTTPGCWRLDGWTSDDRYGYTELSVASDQLLRVRFLSAEDEDPWRRLRLVIEVNTS